jgi:hypothetical protein
VNATKAGRDDGTMDEVGSFLPVLLFCRPASVAHVTYADVCSVREPQYDEHLVTSCDMFIRQETQLENVTSTVSSSCFFIVVAT